MTATITTIVLIALLVFIYARSIKKGKSFREAQEEKNTEAEIDFKRKEFFLESKYDAVVFNLEGTLIDTSGDLTAALNYVLNKHGLDTEEVKDVAGRIDGGMFNILKKSLPDNIKEEDVKQYYKEFVECYSNNLYEYTYPYKGVTSLIANLKELGFLTAVITDKRDVLAKKLTDKFFPDSIDYVEGSDGKIKRADPAMLSNIMVSIETNPEKILYVGSSKEDLKAAKDAGVDNVMVSWGFNNKEKLTGFGAEHIIGEADELYNYLK